VPLEAGPGECARRVLAALVGTMDLRGAAVVLARRGEWIAHGDVAVDGLREVWPTGSQAQALPAGVFGYYWIRDEVLREALAAAKVVLVVPVTSPRGAWGHLFVCAGLLSRWTDREHVETLELAADELALLLDASDLLARAVAVERSLAHAEKLAAIGEVAARIAHEIRNPVTAARSLAQQLAREASPGHDAEYRLVLAELDRVERQVQALLRFSRRESFAFEVADVGDVVRATVADLRPRFEAAEIAVATTVGSGLVARVDREKLRQVLVNLFENAVDALGEVGPGARRLEVRANGGDGAAVIEVSDSGPGVPDHVLPRLFEPFFSLKPHGTGLGLAIAKRTIEAHGGRIEAAAGGAAGLTFRIELPRGAHA
jgi:signal transduction histidine kinase